MGHWRTGTPYPEPVSASLGFLSAQRRLHRAEDCWGREGSGPGGVARRVQPHCNQGQRSGPCPAPTVSSPPVPHSPLPEGFSSRPFDTPIGSNHSNKMELRFSHFPLCQENVAGSPGGEGGRGAEGDGKARARLRRRGGPEPRNAGRPPGPGLGGGRAV